MQVERVVAGDVVGQNSAVDMHRTLGPARGAAGEVQERHVVGVGRWYLEPVRGFRHQAVPGQRSRCGFAAAEEDDMRKVRKAIADLLDLAAVQCLAGHEHPSLAHLQAGGDRLGPEGGEQGRHHASVLQRPQSRHVELRHAAGQDEYALAHADTEPLQDIGEAVGGGSQRAEAEIPALAGAPEPAKRQMIGARTPRGDPPPRGRCSGLASAGRPASAAPRPIGSHGSPRRSRSGSVAAEGATKPS